jgi:hypothetical protein
LRTRAILGRSEKLVLRWPRRGKRIEIVLDQLLLDVISETAA